MFDSHAMECSMTRLSSELTFHPEREDRKDLFDVHELSGIHMASAAASYSDPRSQPMRAGPGSADEHEGVDYSCEQTFISILTMCTYMAGSTTDARMKQNERTIQSKIPPNQP